MNFQKFQTNLIKAAEARDGLNKPFPPGNMYQSNDRFTYIAMNGNYIVGIPNRFFYLDAKKVFDKPEWDGFKSFLNDAADTKPAIDTHVIREVDLHGKKNTFHKFMVNDEAVYIDEKFYKEFYQMYLKDETKACKFTGLTAKSPIYLWYHDEVVGIILPVFVRGENNVF